MNSKFESLFWDIGGVLFSDVNIAQKEFAPIRRALSISATRSDEIFDELWPQGVRLGKITEDEYWKVYQSRTKGGASLKKVKFLYRRLIKPNYELLRVVSKLSKKYQQFIISNQGKEWMEFIVKRWKLDRYFEEVFCSSWLGIAKPDPGIFRIALEKSDTIPQRTLYIDDSETNIISAGELGISGIIYKSNEQLINELRNQQIL